MRVTVWCTILRVEIIGLRFFEENERAISVTSDPYTHITKGVRSAKTR